MTRDSRWGPAMVAALTLVLLSCKGDQGPAGPAGPPGGTGTDGGTGGTAAANPARLYAQLTGASVPNGGGAGGAPSVTYRLFTDAAYTQSAGTCAGGGSSAYAAFSPNLTIAKQVDDTTVPGTKRWQSYINRLIGTTKVATTEGGRGSVAGTVKDNGDGSCTYTFKSDLSQVAAPSTSAAAVTEPYDPNAITRFGMQNNPNTVDATHPVFDGWVDVVPASGQVQSGNTRAIVATQACNQCHFDLAHHGGKRLSTEYCVTCHNAGTPDPNPSSVGSTSLDFAVMIHKIHQGGDLPSVTGKEVNGTAIAGAPTNGTIVINGTDFTFVGFPQNTGNCIVCHAVTSGTGSDFWKNQPSIEACGACHDRVDFTAAAPGGTGNPPKAGFIAHTAGAVQDGQCANCHAESATIGGNVHVTQVHRIGITPAAQQVQVLKVVSATVTPGQKPTVTFLVTDPANGNAAVDVTTDARWNSGGASRLFVDVGWSNNPGEDWTNRGSGVVTGFGAIAPAGSPAPGQPLSFDAVAAAKTGTKNGDGSFTVTAPAAVDASATGTGVVVLEGHPAVNGAAVPVTTATLPVAITDSAAVPRRTVVDIQKCDKCHGFLSLHGGNRNDNVQACVVCHNSEATDVTQRKGAGIDNKTEQSIHFAALVHGIHAGAEPPFTQGIVIYAFTGAAAGAGTPNPVDFRDVKFPEGNSVGRCNVCHADSNPFPTAQMGVVNGLTIDTLVGASGAISADQTLYLRTTPIAGVCSSCHQSSTATAHMSQNGAVGFATVGTNAIAAPGKTEGDILAAGTLGLAGAETCIVCHGPGQIADPTKFHGH